MPLVRLTPGENTFVIFCIPGDAETTWREDGAYSTVGANIHSPSGSSQWEAITYFSSDSSQETEGFALLERRDTNNSEYDTYAYDEETFDGRTFSLNDPWMKWIRFAEIYHPDAQQDDTIYAIEVMAYPPEFGDYEEIDIVLERLVNTFEDLGATNVQEIFVEEALKRFHIIVSEEDAD